jgi:pimeloyl-ACP methyl ester carboxylesterase
MPNCRALPRQNKSWRRLVLVLSCQSFMPSVSEAYTVMPSPYGTFQGTLFQYSGTNLVAFESNPSSSKKIILLGGLSDGLILTPYTKLIEEKAIDWSLVQPILSSSYLGFGMGDLDRDVEELSQLMRYLRVRHNAQHVALVGHSTGCQISVHLLLKRDLDSDIANLLRIVALQAPVSDREGTSQQDPKHYESNLQIARTKLENGQGNEMMPRSSFWAPITAKRYWDLHAKGGMDDYFSSDWTDDELIDRLGHVGRYSPNLQTILVAFSGADEYVPKDIDTKGLTQRLCDAMNHHRNDRKSDNCDEQQQEQKPLAIPLYLATGNHNLSQSPGDAERFVDRFGVSSKA